MYAPSPMMTPSMVPMAPMAPMTPMVPMAPMMAAPVMAPPMMVAPPPPMYYPSPPPPVYYPPPPPPPPPPSAPATIIITGGNNNDSSGSPCSSCGRDTGNVVRKKVGCVALAWCICLLLTTGFACYIPLTRDSCKDTELVCNRCSTVKAVIHANCCWSSSSFLNHSLVFPYRKDLHIFCPFSFTRLTKSFSHFTTIKIFCLH